LDLLVEGEHPACDEFPKIVGEDVDCSRGIVWEAREGRFDVGCDEGVEVFERGVERGAVEEREDW